MNKKEAFERRLCHVGSERPTIRDQWQAFYRIHRMLEGSDAYREIGAKESLMVLFPGRWTCLVNASTTDGLVDRSTYPMFLRKSLLEGIRRKRLRMYGGSPERDRAVAKMVRDLYGREVTPDEVAEVRFKVMSMVRTISEKHGAEPPQDISQLASLLKRGRPS